ncbi:hypothetical protein GCM10009740_31570 [Terrabacter terrae]|uniref:HNH endonuclease n=1 Tax=Terrabacter terrae TaxID=318434 RepID=A0ABN2UJC3_9MICO
MANATLPEVITNDDPNAALCTAGGVDHDYRPHTYRSNGRPHTSLRCVWCHVVACGDIDEADPCIEPYHHHGDHRTRSGVTWPKGGCRPTTTEEPA